MKRGSTLFLRLVIFIMGLAALALCLFGLPAISRGLVNEFPEVPYIQYSVLIAYVAALPFFIALYQALKLLSSIDKNKAFSDVSVHALGIIKYSAIAISILFAGAMPFWYGIAQSDDAPGVIIIGGFFFGAPLVIAVFAALLQKLLTSAIEIKSENDLTV